MCSLYKTHGRLCTSMASSTFRATQRSMCTSGSSFTPRNDEHGGQENADEFRTVMMSNLVSSSRTAVQREFPEVEEGSTLSQDNRLLAVMKSDKRLLAAKKRENEQLRMAKTCKVCLSAEVHILFLPCRHLACCEKCAPSLHVCPVCRNLVQGTVKTYFA